MLLGRHRWAISYDSDSFLFRLYPLPRVRLLMLLLSHSIRVISHTHTLTCNSVARSLVTGINRDRFDPIYGIVPLSSTTTITIKSSYTLVTPMRPEKRTVAVPPLDPEPLNTRSNNQAPPPPTPTIAESNQTPQRTAAPQRPISLVVRNTKRSRNKHSHPYIPRHNHYLLARSLVENDQPPTPKSLVPEQNPRPIRKVVLPRFHREPFPPDFTISDFIWQFSEPDSQIDDVFAALKSYDPQTFNEFVAGFD